MAQDMQKLVIVGMARRARAALSAASSAACGSRLTLRCSKKPRARSGRQYRFSRRNIRMDRRIGSGPV